MLRLSRWVEKAGDREVSAVGGGLAILLLGQATMLLHELAKTPALPAEASLWARQALASVSDIEGKPDSAVADLMRTAEALSSSHASEARILQDAAGAVASHAAFFSRRRAKGGDSRAASGR